GGVRGRTTGIPTRSAILSPRGKSEKGDRTCDVRGPVPFFGQEALCARHAMGVTLCGGRALGKRLPVRKPGRCLMFGTAMPGWASRGRDRLPRNQKLPALYRVLAERGTEPLAR